MNCIQCILVKDFRFCSITQSDYSPTIYMSLYVHLINCILYKNTGFFKLKGGFVF